jgi:hypothetical protein
MVGVSWRKAAISPLFLPFSFLSLHAQRERKGEMERASARGRERQRERARARERASERARERERESV